MIMGAIDTKKGGNPDPNTFFITIHIFIVYSKNLTG